MRVHGRRRSEPDLLADLANGRWVAVVIDVRDEEFPDLLLALGEQATPFGGEHAFESSGPTGRRQGSPGSIRRRDRHGGRGELTGGTGRSPVGERIGGEAAMSVYTVGRALVAELVDAQG